MPITPRNSHKRYVPILKSKASELDALANISSNTSQAICPLIELPDASSLKDSSTLTKLSTKISSAWPYPAPIFFDAANGCSAPNSSLTPSPLHALFASLSSSCPAFIPVTDPYRDANYQTAILQSCNSFVNGLCLRIPGPWINPNGSQTLIHDIHNLCTNMSVAISCVDLVIDFSDIPNNAPINLYVTWVEQAITQMSTAGAWRSVTFAASSFPNVVPSNSRAILPIKRTEFIIWNQLIASNNIINTPDFGDYTCHSATHAVIPTFAFANAACKIRYTSDSEWLTIKGQSLQRGAGAGQYYTLAAQIASNSNFCGPSFSFGDQYIATRAAGQGTSGGHRQWLTADINHHITYTAAQL